MAYYSGRLLIFSDVSGTQYNIYGQPPTVCYNYFLDFEENNNFISIWSDQKSSRKIGKLQIATENGFFVIDLENKNLYDKYTYTIRGRSNETLEQEDIKDITIGE